MLLVVVLIMLLMGAVVFNFSSVQKSARLDEGSSQLDSLFHFLRAQAAHTGRRINLHLPQGGGDPLSLGSERLRAEWEPDGSEGVETPGILHEAGVFLSALEDNIRIQVMQDADSPAGSEGLESQGLPDEPRPQADADGRAMSVPPVSFYPDGSSDSIELRVTSVEEDDRRLLIARWQGLTGSFHRHWTLREELQPGVPAVEP